MKIYLTEEELERKEREAEDGIAVIFYSIMAGIIFLLCLVVWLIL